jgi:hypothetical protein
MPYSNFIYVRTHESYLKYNAVKLGKTFNLVNRDSTYKTGEILKGSFILVIKVKNASIIENVLKNHFNNLNLNIYINAV